MVKGKAVCGNRVTPCPIQHAPDSDASCCVNCQKKAPVTPMSKVKGMPKGQKLLLWKYEHGLDVGSAKCHCCPATIYQGDFEAAHVKARAAGGPATTTNLKCTCHRCNAWMADTHMDVWNDWIRAIENTMAPSKRAALVSIINQNEADEEWPEWDVTPSTSLCDMIGRWLW